MTLHWTKPAHVRENCPLCRVQDEAEAQALREQRRVDRALAVALGIAFAVLLYQGLCARFI